MFNFFPGSGTTWSNARPVWNQFNYFNVHVNDDLTIPRIQQQHHLVNNGVLNNYLSQYSPPRLEDLDLELRSADSFCNAISFEVCNRREINFEDSLSASLYASLDSALLYTFTQYVGLETDSCREYVLNVELDQSIKSLFIVINDNGLYNLFDIDSLPNTGLTECSYLNNIRLVPNKSSIDSLEISINQDLNFCGEVALSVPSGEFEYLWSDGSSESNLLVLVDGVFEVTVTDACGNQATDSVSVSISPCYGSEVCNNGLDDDGDGLIDCYDEDCCGLDMCQDFWYRGCLDTICIYQGSQKFTIESMAYSPPEISVFSNVVAGDIDYDGDTDIAIANGKKEIYLIEGSSGELVNTITLEKEFGFGVIGIAEITSRHPGAEIVAYNGRASLYTMNGDLIWKSEKIGFAGSCSFADFNQDGVSEIYTEYAILDGLTGRTIINIPETFPSTAVIALSVAIDILPTNQCPDCGGLELVTNSKIYAIDLINDTFSLEVDYSDIFASDAICVIVDWNNDGLQDVISFGQKRIDVWSPQDLSTIHTYSRPSLRRGLPNVGDVDGDGMVELTFLDDIDGGTMTCLDNDFSTLWERNVMDGSGLTGMTLFDFDNDGGKEIVFRDEEYLRIINGINGKDLEIISCKSATGPEFPIVADINHDQQANVLVVCGDEYLSTDGQLYNFFPGEGSSWSNARPVWNQINYFNTHINDDLSVPVVQQMHHLLNSDGLNSFLNQYSPPREILLDLELLEAEYSCQSFLLTLCNVGEKYFGDSLNASLYNSSNNELLETFTFFLEIEINECLEYQLEIPLNDSVSEFGIIINDEGKNSSRPFGSGFIPNTDILECSYQNNKYKPIQIGLFDSLEIQIDSIVSSCGETTIFGPSGMLNYEWSTGSKDPFIVVTESRSYSLKVTNDCGITGSTMVDVHVDPCIEYVHASFMDSICLGEVYHFNGIFLDSSGIYVDTIRVAERKDSIILLSLIVLDGIDVELPSVLMIDANKDFQIEIIGEVGSDISIQWSPIGIVSCISCLDPIFNISNDTVLTLFLSNGKCDTVILIYLKTIKENDVYVPNIFSPNQDGVNDLFTAYPKDESQLGAFEVYDRWGNIVYSYDGLISGISWDGTLGAGMVDQGVFVYKLIILGKDNPIILKGSITLIR